MRKSRWLVLSLSLCLAATACGSDDETSNGRPDSTSAAVTAPGATEPVSTEPGATEPVSTEPGATEPVSTEPVSTEPIKIGGIWSTSGPLAAVGTVERDAAQLRIDEINEDGGINGREVELIVRDGESKAEVAVSAARELIESENVVAILGPESLTMQVAVGEVATAAGVPNVSAQGGKFFGGEGSEYQWSTAALGTDSLNVARRYWEANGITKIGLIRTADALGEAAPAQVDAVLEGTGIEVVSDQQVQGTDTSVLAQMGNIKAAGAESVWVHNGGAIVPVAAQAFHELELPGFLLAFTDSVALIPAFGDAIEDYRAVSSLGAVPGIVPDDHPSAVALKQFAADFESTYGVAANSFASWGYDGATIVLQAIEAVGDDRQAVAEYMNDISWTGLNGTRTWTPDNHVSFDPAGMLFLEVNPARDGWVVTAID